MCISIYAADVISKRHIPDKNIGGIRVNYNKRLLLKIPWHPNKYALHTPKTHLYETVLTASITGISANMGWLIYCSHSAYRIILHSFLSSSDICYKN